MPMSTYRYLAIPGVYEGTCFALGWQCSSVQLMVVAKGNDPELVRRCAEMLLAHDDVVVYDTHLRVAYYTYGQGLDPYAFEASEKP